MRNLKDELDVSLNEIDRWWIRKPATIILSIMIFFILISVIIFNSIFYIFKEFYKAYNEWWYGFVVECWIGKKDLD